MLICFPRGITPNTFKDHDKSIISTFKDVIFFSYSLDQASEILEWLVNNPDKDLDHNILIDTANSHMQHMVNLLRELKVKPKLRLWSVIFPTARLRAASRSGVFLPAAPLLFASAYFIIFLKIYTKNINQLN